MIFNFNILLLMKSMCEYNRISAHTFRNTIQPMYNSHFLDGQNNSLADHPQQPTAPKKVTDENRLPNPPNKLPAITPTILLYTIPDNAPKLTSRLVIDLSFTAKLAAEYNNKNADPATSAGNVPTNGKRPPY
mmetsp:Transcript_14693/g.17380  ORF Transcript_14693/g.17380 Transcript_14693/m.17380 type:complete len:132 (+) Transcript_14693:159-554(+)